MIQREAFDPILREAKGYGVQWETTRLLAIEIPLSVHWTNNRFTVTGDSMIDPNATDPDTLFFERGLTYRLQLDHSTHGKPLMIGYSPEDSEKAYNQNILGNGSGQADMLFRFDNPFPDFGVEPNTQWKKYHLGQGGKNKELLCFYRIGRNQNF